MPWTRDEMAAIAALELNDGDYANLGIGIPQIRTCRQTVITYLNPLPRPSRMASFSAVRTIIARAVVYMFEAFVAWALAGAAISCEALRTYFPRWPLSSIADQ